MPYLGDYLGQLMAEISIARMQADLETVRIAELYASHPLLRTLPIPRMRLPDVDLDVPVAITGVEQARPGEPARGGISIGDLRKKFGDVLSAQLEKSGLSLTAAERAAVDASLDADVARLTLPNEIGLDVSSTTAELSATALRVVQKIVSARPIPNAATPPEVPSEEVLRDAARLEILKERSTPPRLSVAVTTAEVREAGENITRLRLKISENSLEWTSVESGGVKSDRLIPE